MIYEKTIKGGGMWSQVIGRNKSLRLTDLEGRANVGMLMYQADFPIERYNMPDTLKGQHIFYLTSPFCLHSDMGRLFASITEDTAGWHDTVCGTTDAKWVRDRYGVKTFQEARNEFYRNGRENFLIEMAKWGLGPRDLVPNINWFSKVVSDEEGVLTFDPSQSTPGQSVELRFEMRTLVVLHTCQHPLDPSPVYQPGRVKLEVSNVDPAGPEDPCRLSRPENGRAFTNTENSHALSE
ncbi:MAG: urea amidolyase associated protein UAAP1 [Verrucomicrobiota bacterium]